LDPSKLQLFKILRFPDWASSPLLITTFVPPFLFSSVYSAAVKSLFTIVCGKSIFDPNWGENANLDTWYPVFRAEERLFCQDLYRLGTALADEYKQIAENSI